MNARFSAPPMGPLAAARTAPSLTRSATIAERLATLDRAVSAAFCVRTSKVVLTGVPGLGSARNSSLSDAGVTSPSGALRSTTTLVPAVPRNCLSNAAAPAVTDEGRPRRISPGFLSTSP